MDEAADRGHLHGYGDPAAKRTKLQEIVERRERDVAEARVLKSAEVLSAEAEKFVATFGPARSLVDSMATAEASPWGLALAAEFKRASPSKGDINAGLDAAQQALEYTKVGASVLSVLTEPTWFKGSLKDLREVREQTQRWSEKNSLPRPVCLRKDFLIDEYQVLEAVAHGADTVLLMVSILSRAKLRALIACCRSHGIEPLVEVVTARELEVALDAGARVLGVNNRNLHTFELDRGRTAQLAEELKTTFKVAFGPGTDVKLMALSGLATADDVDECRKIACSGVLVGEALMRASDPGAAILELMGGSGEVLPVAPGSVLAKICGVKRPEDARVAVEAGANLVGVIFAASKRRASLEDARAVVTEVRRFGERGELVRRPAATDSQGFTARCCALRRACKRSPLVVGVFLDQPLDEVISTVEDSGVDAVQLHGQEDVAFLEALRKRLPTAWLIRVVHLPPAADGVRLGDDELVALRARLENFGATCDTLLLDTSVKGSTTGGTGATFDWELARTVQDEWRLPIVVAGGLTDTNVAELVTSVLPFGVDVASGVEDSPGVKNAEKSTAYVRNAKRARLGA